MGARLGYGGVVEGEGIRCPFHAWHFGVDGRCDDVPYDRARRPPGRRAALLAGARDERPRACPLQRVGAGTACVVSDSSVFQNAWGGIRVGKGGTVSGNAVFENQQSGPYGGGIQLTDGGLASGNSVTGNTGHGIQSEGGGATVVFNTANGNTGWGFQGAPSITDTLGGNNFVGNGSGGAINAIAIQCNTTNGVPFCPP
jgi:Rieske 2Fe-2S protein